MVLEMSCVIVERNSAVGDRSAAVPRRDPGDRAEQGSARTDILRRAGYSPPTAAARVSTTFAGIKRARRGPVDKKTALVLDRLRAAIQTIPETLPGRRDRALLLVGFSRGQMAQHADGIEFYLPCCTNDQDGRGTGLWLRVGRTGLCPVTAVDAWLGRRRNHRGPSISANLALPSPRVPRALDPKPVSACYRVGADPIDTDSIAPRPRTSEPYICRTRRLWTGR
jgi:hypothetical protein